MLSELFTTWDIIKYSAQGIIPVLVLAVKVLFTDALLPFTILGIISLLIRKKAH